MILLQGYFIPYLYSIFDEIIDNGDFDFFHPHPFTKEQASLICNYTGRDLYFISITDGKPSSYAFLRGFDEGYTIPSLGIYVCEKYRGTGLARKNMDFLHNTAFLNGAEKVRLTVLKKNEKAIAFYKKIGYLLEEDQEGESLLGFFSK